MTECIQYGNSVLQKVYGGMACQPHPASSYNGNLPFTGFELTTFIVLGTVLVIAGYFLRNVQRSRS